MAVYLGDVNFASSSNSQALLYQTVQGLVTYTLVGTVYANSVFSIEVVVEGAGGQTVSTYSGPWSLTTLSAPSGGVVEVTAATLFTNGVVFANLDLTASGTYVLQITTSGMLTTMTIVAH